MKQKENKLQIKELLSKVKEWANEQPDKRTCIAICSEKNGSLYQTDAVDAGLSISIAKCIVAMMMAEKDFAALLKECVEIYEQMKAKGEVCVINATKGNKA